MGVTTRAAVLRAQDQPYEIEEITLDDLKPGEVLVKIVSAGMCHTDIVTRGRPVFPIILGHEGAGVVAELGPGVTGIAVGDHVVVTFSSCGRCLSCLRGEPAYCVEFFHRNMTGRHPDGTTSATDRSGAQVANRFFGQSSFAEHVITEIRNLVVVDPDVPLELLGPLGCGLQTGAGTVLNEMRLAAGQSIAVFGAGGVGLAAVMAAKLSGASDIVVVDLHETRLRKAAELGATRTVVGGTRDVAEQVIGTGTGMDFVLETSGVNDVVLAAISALGTGGLAVLVGSPQPIDGLLPTKLMGRKVTYSLEGNAVPQLLIPQLIRFWQEGRFPFDQLIRSYDLASINDAEADSRSGVTIKPVLVPDRGRPLPRGRG